MTDPRQFLRKAARMLLSSPTFEDALQQTVVAALPTLGDFSFFDIVDDGSVRRTARAHEADDIEAFLKTTQWVRQCGSTDQCRRGRRAQSQFELDSFGLAQCSTAEVRLCGVRSQTWNVR